MKTDYHVFVTSNKSYTHIIVGEADKTLCGIGNEAIEQKQPRFPYSEIRETYSEHDFLKFVRDNRDLYSELRFCKRCIKAFDRTIKDD